MIQAVNATRQCFQSKPLVMRLIALKTADGGRLVLSPLADRILWPNEVAEILKSHKVVHAFGLDQWYRDRLNEKLLLTGDRESLVIQGSSGGIAHCCMIGRYGDA